MYCYVESQYWGDEKVLVILLYDEFDSNLDQNFAFLPWSSYGETKENAIEFLADANFPEVEIKWEKCNIID